MAHKSASSRSFLELKDRAMNLFSSHEVSKPFAVANILSQMSLSDFEEFVNSSSQASKGDDLDCISEIDRRLGYPVGTSKRHIKSEVIPSLEDFSSSFEVARSAFESKQFKISSIESAFRLSDSDEAFLLRELIICWSGSPKSFNYLVIRNDELFLACKGYLASKGLAFASAICLAQHAIDSGWGELPEFFEQL